MIVSMFISGFFGLDFRVYVPYHSGISFAVFSQQNSMKFVKQVVLEDETKLKGIPPEDCSKIMLWSLHYRFWGSHTNQSMKRAKRNSIILFFFFQVIFMILFILFFSFPFLNFWSDRYETMPTFLLLKYVAEITKFMLYELRYVGPIYRNLQQKRNTYLCSFL